MLNVVHVRAGRGRPQKEWGVGAAYAMSGVVAAPLEWVAVRRPFIPLPASPSLEEVIMPAPATVGSDTWSGSFVSCGL